MRPRHKAAENARPRERPLLASTASMRPRHKAAENGDHSAAFVEGQEGFNEAAA